MMRCVIALLRSACLAAAIDRHVLYERDIFPPSWHLVGRASSRQRTHLLIAVKQQQLRKLEERFWAVSDPKSSQWQHFMSADEIGQLVASKAQDMHVVMTWLKEGLSNDATVRQTHDAVEVRLSVGDAEKLLKAELHVFVHENGHTIVRALGAHSVPTNVHAAIDFVEGVADFPMHRSSVRKHAKPTEKTAQPQSKIALVSPETLLKMYSVPELSSESQVSQGPAEFQADTSYNKQDLNTFFKQTNIASERVQDIVGPYDGSEPDTEATLDVQYIMSVGEKQVDWYWTSDAWMYTWSHNFFNHGDVPDAVSISWGWAEDQQCSSGISQGRCQTLGIDSEKYVARVNTEFQKIGLRGVSLFVASGDSGANGRSDGQCTDKKLHASFPGSSPYVTAVGATMLQNPEFNLKNPPKACSALGNGYACASGGTEVAVSSEAAGFTSGGGFSTYTAMPPYQDEAVKAYLVTMTGELPPASYFNASKRGYPDIAAMGNNFLIYMQSVGGWSPVGGTSAATPTVAGVAAHLNDLSYKKTGKPLGFMNPLFYQMHKEMPETFTDVTIGDNRCTEDGCFASCQGYKAAKGWDPVTGLGTPVADKMVAYVQQLLEKRAQQQVVV